MMTKNTPNTTPSPYEISAWILTACALFAVLILGLLPALLAGLLVFELVHIITPYLARHFLSRHSTGLSKIWAVGILVFVVVSLLVVAGASLLTFLRSDSGSVTVLLAKMAQIVEDSRKILPSWLLERLPADANSFRENAAVWLRIHADELQVVGKEAGRVTIHILIGMIIGGILALREAVMIEEFKPFSRAMLGRSRLFSDAFRRVVFAQLRIAAINTSFTAIYLLLVLPLMG
ncbi:MAG: hypothetical protein RL063_161, partial [Pseudomonadota bacterium]